MILDKHAAERGIGAIDVLAHDERYDVLVDVPGIAPEDLDVAIEGRTLTIAGERRRDGTVHRFDRRIMLGDAVQADEVAARLNDGVLRITVPRAGRARRIEIGGRVALEHGEGRRRRPWERVGLRHGPQLRDSLRRLARR